MLLKNISALIGENLDFVSNIDIQIKDEKFQKIHSNIKSNSKKDIINCEGLLLIPGFINSHTHIADSIGKDITLNSTVNQKIHPMFGIKSKILTAFFTLFVCKCPNKCHLIFSCNSFFFIIAS